MKTEKIIWGLILVFIGGILLLQNFGVIDFQWLVIWRFWPLILILIGANMLFSRENSRMGAIISVILTVAALAFIGWQGSVNNYDSHPDWLFRYKRDTGDWENRKTRSNTFSEKYIPGTKYATLNISGGATNYILKDSTSGLFSAVVNSSFGDYSLLKVSKDSSEVLDFKMGGKGDWHMGGRGGNKAVMSLNVNPVWDINVETGAGKSNFDLSVFKIRNISFQGGASTLDLKLGEPQVLSTVNIETGVSTIRIAIPSSAGCQIKTDSGLSSNDFEGFSKQSDDSYITSNFNTASRKIIINLEGGLSKFDVRRY